jgi:hypothetical protein
MKSWRSRNPVLANVLAVAIAAILVGWPAYGVLRDDFVIPVSRHGNGSYQHFHGSATWLMLAGFACVSASILIEVLLRLKAKTNSDTLQKVTPILAMLGTFVILAMLLLKTFGLL